MTETEGHPLGMNARRKAAADLLDEKQRQLVTTAHKIEAAQHAEWLGEIDRILELEVDKLVATELQSATLSGLSAQVATVATLRKLSKWPERLEAERKKLEASIEKQAAEVEKLNP